MEFWYVLKEILKNLDQQTVFQETVAKIKSISCNCWIIQREQSTDEISLLFRTIDLFLFF